MAFILLPVFHFSPPQNLQATCGSVGVNSDLPWIMLMSGANCYSQDYSLLEQQLAGRGYLVAIVDELHPITPEYSYALSREHLTHLLTI